MGQTHRTTASCAFGSRADTVFRFTTTTPGDVVVEVRPTDTQQLLVASLRSNCEQPTTEPAGACVKAALEGSQVALHQRGLPAGTWYLWIDGDSADVGAFSVSVRHTAAPAGDSCSAPVLLTTTNAALSLAGSTRDAGNDFSPSCSSTPSNDLVYQLDLTAPSNLIVRPDGPGWAPLLAVRSGSCQGPEVACTNFAQTLGAELDAGTWFVWLDGSTAASGEFALHARVGPPPDGDHCSNAIPLTFTNGQASVTNSTRYALVDTTSSCGGSVGDIVYTFTTTMPLDLRATATGLTGGTPVLTLRNGACPGTQRTCVTGSTTLAQQQLPAGTWSLWVGGFGNTGGDFRLDVSLTPQLIGDVCTNPRTLTFVGTDGGVATDSDDTARFFNDTAPACALQASGGDVAYTFTTDRVLDFSATVAGGNSSYRPSVALRGGTCAVPQELSCGASLTSSTTGLSYGGLPPGTYTLWVDGEASTSGPYTLTARTQTPLPGDTCLNPITLDLPGGTAGTLTASGDLRPLFDQVDGVCAAGNPSGDAVYTFTTTTMLDLRATVQSTLSTFAPAVYLRSSCAGGDVSCAVATVNGGSARLGAGALAPGTWYLWVDGQATTEGPYNLSVVLSAPTPGEACGSVVPLVFSGGTASASGDTTANLTDNSSNCGAAASPDVVYSFTTTATQNFTATLAPGNSTYRPLLSLRTTSCTSGMERCASAASAGANATLSVPTLPAGTYYLWVDGASGTAGPFTLNATLQ